MVGIKYTYTFLFWIFYFVSQDEHQINIRRDFVQGIQIFHFFLLFIKNKQNDTVYYPRQYRMFLPINLTF